MSFSKSDSQRQSPRPADSASTAPSSEANESSADDGKETVRNIGQKSFFLKNNQWRDSTVTEAQEKQAIRIKQFSNEYFDLAATHGGELAKYLAFNEPVLLNLGDKTYQIDPPDEPTDSNGNN